MQPGVSIPQHIAGSAMSAPAEGPSKSLGFVVSTPGLRTVRQPPRTSCHPRETVPPVRPSSGATVTDRRSRRWSSPNLAGAVRSEALRITRAASRLADALDGEQEARDRGRYGDQEVTADDHARLERLAVHLSVSTIARAALLVGLEIIEAQPGVLLGEKPKRR